MLILTRNKKTEGQLKFWYLQKVTIFVGQKSTGCIFFTHPHNSSRICLDGMSDHISYDLGRAF